MSTPPAIDYTNKDYASLRQALLELAQLRLPEWSDRSYESKIHDYYGVGPYWTM